MNFSVVFSPQEPHLGGLKLYKVSVFHLIFKVCYATFFDGGVML